jgi:hypothetical protein
MMASRGMAYEIHAQLSTIRAQVDARGMAEFRSASMLNIRRHWWSRKQLYKSVGSSFLQILSGYPFLS